MLLSWGVFASRPVQCVSPSSACSPPAAPPPSSPSPPPLQVPDLCGRVCLWVGLHGPALPGSPAQVHRWPALLLPRLCGGARWQQAARGAQVRGGWMEGLGAAGLGAWCVGESCRCGAPCSLLPCKSHCPHIECRPTPTPPCRRNLSRETAWEAVMRIRCSKGLRVSAFFGHFFIRSTGGFSAR